MKIQNADDAETTESAEEEIKPIGKGIFGNIYDQFKGKVKEAFDFLLRRKSGDLIGVFHDDELGDIDLVWGSKEDNAGLEHIIDKHVGEGKDFATVDEAQKTIADVIANGKKIKEKWDKVTFDLNGKRVVIRRNTRDKEGNVVDEKKNWVVTSFDNNIPKSEKVSSASTLATPESISEGRAVAPNESSTPRYTDEQKECSEKEDIKKRSSNIHIGTIPMYMQGR